MSQSLEKTPDSKPSPPKFHSYPFWCPRFWHGMRFGDWMRLAARNRFRIHPLRIPMAVAISLITPFNSVMHRVQRAIYGRRIDATEISEPPVFIIGHWRSGTTYLHELMVLDDRFAYPTTYECFAPHHFLLTEWFFQTFGGFLVPKRRPMDNMAAGWKRPQEDEFALLTLGVPTPYLRMAFPNHPPADMEYLDMQQVDEESLNVWKQALLTFVRLLTFKHEKPIMLKSPPHTGRVAVLAEMFPNAKFIHIVRSPFSIFPSTVRLWQSLDLVQAFQLPGHENLESYVFDCFERMYHGFEQQRASLAPERICDVRYEDLVQDPVRELAKIYEQLQLGDFEYVRSKLEEFASDQKDYQTNLHELPENIKGEICRRWAAYIEKYGYSEQVASV